MQTNEGTVRLYSDVLHAGQCTTHTAPPFDRLEPGGPLDGDDGAGDDSGGDDGTGGENGSFLDWLLGNGGN